MTTEMDSEVQKMCLNCHKLEPDGSCAWLWVTSEEQKKRAAQGVCLDSVTFDANGNRLFTSQVKLNYPIKSTWITWIKK